LASRLPLGSALFPLQVQRQANQAEDLIPPGWIGISSGFEELTDQPSDVLAVEQVGGGGAFVPAVKSASHRYSNTKADYLTLLLDLKQLSVDPVHEDLAGKADPPILIRHAKGRLV
jgi:hypothetical protein